MKPSKRSQVCRTLRCRFKIKTEVFGYLPQYVSYRADVEEIRSKMGNYPYLTRYLIRKEGKLIPLGIIHANDLHQTILGTVTLRDFCNREETKIPPYLEVISVIDHHKSNFKYFTPPVRYHCRYPVIECLCAELAFKINDRFSTVE